MNSKLMMRIARLGLVCTGVAAILNLSAQAQTLPANEWVEIPAPVDQTFNNLNIPADAASKGMWSPVYDWPMNGLHAALLSNGRVLTFGSSLDGNAQDGRWYDVWDPALGFGSNAHNTIYDPSRQDSFCAAALPLADGSLMISGGNGSDTSTIYDVGSHSSFTANERMAEARWYPTLINLADGRPIILGGMMPYTEDMQDQPDQAIANGWPSMTPEVYENGQWRSLFGAYSRLAFGPDYLRTSYPRAWVAPDGRVFGISADQMWFLEPDGNNNLGVITSAGLFKGPPSKTAPKNVGATNTAVMFAPGKILQVGGNGGFNGDELPGSNMATLIDINSGSPVLTEQPPMSFARRYPNAIVLANGEVVITGGATYGNFYNGQPASAVYMAEIWDSTAGVWRAGASAARYRGYHSITTLLANGAILSTGGGTPGPVTNLNAEVYYPPYLFESNGGNSVLASRPVMVAISGLSYNNGATMQVDMDDSDPISQLVLIGTSSGTHSFNSGQRRIPLTFSQQQFRLSATIPNNNLVPPGYYQVVAIGANGAPSYGTIVGIGQNQAVPPIVTTPYDPPNLNLDIQTPVIHAGESASYSVTEVAGSTYSWEVSDGTISPYSASGAFTHTFSSAGLFTVTINAKDANGIVASYTFVQAVSVANSGFKPLQSSQIVFDAQANRLWVVNPDNNSVAVINTLNNTKVAEIDVGDSPRNVALAANNEVWVTNKHSASISVINRSTLSIVQTIDLPYGSQPHGLVFNAAGTEAYVALEASGQLIRIAQDIKQTVNTLALGLNIRHLAYDATTDRVLVTRFITPLLAGESTATVDTLSGGGEVMVVDAGSFSLSNTVLLQHSNKADTSITGSGLPNYLGAPAISPDGSLAWVPSKQDNITRGTLRSGQPLDFQNSVRAISSLITLSDLQEDFARRVDHDNAGLSSAASFHPNGVYLFVALETSREVAVINAISGAELFRVAVGIAPQSVTLADDGLTLFVKNFIDRSVSVVDLTDLITTGQLRAKVTATVDTVQNEALAADVLLGKAFFYDAKDTRLSRDAYLSCASCHNDGGQDGRVWDFTGFGEGLRNTIELRGRGDMLHGLLHWSGNFDEVQDFEKQIRNFAGGSGLMADADFFSTSVEAEAFENTTLVAPFAQSTSAGRTVMSWSGTGQLWGTPTDTATGQLHYSVKPTASSMTLFAMVDMPSGNDDSFYYKLEGVDAGWGTFNNQATTGFQEREIVTWNGLNVGQTYTLKIQRREDGALLDSFRVTGGQFGSSDTLAGKSADLDALASYLGSLQGSAPSKGFGPSPYRNADGSYTAAAIAGETLFNENCVSCHGGANFTNSSDELAFADVGTINSASGQRLGAALTALDVPTLRGVWATAPYLHNGSAPTLADAISAHQGISLSTSELNDLTAYVLQIDGDSQAGSSPEAYFDVQQAEDQAWLDGSIDTNHSGYFGSGFVHLAAGLGNWLEFDLNLPLAGAYDLSLRFANGGADSAYAVYVNGSLQIPILELPATASWTSWAETPFTLDLSAGANLVRLVALDEDVVVASIEAEQYQNASLVSPFTQSTNAGRTIMSWATTGQINLTPTDTTTGQLHFSVTATAPSMTLFAVVNLPSYNDDSFYYKLEGVDGAWGTFNNQATSGFQEREIATWNGLTVGQTYTLKIQRREDGALLDYFRVTGGQFGSGTTTPNIDQLTIQGKETLPSNLPPVVIQPIGDQTVAAGESAIIDLNNVFSDPESDPLSFTVSPSTNLSLVGNSLQIQGSDVGSETITVTASDGNAQASVQFTLTVTSTNSAPVVQTPIADQAMTFGDSDVNVALDTIFADPDGDNLSYALVTSDTNVQLSGTVLTIGANTVGASSYTVTASDGQYQVSTAFTLSVGSNNTAPVVQLPIPNQTMLVGDANINIALNTVFVDPDGDVLNFSLATVDSRVQLSGTDLIISASTVGSVPYTVTASDGEYEVSTTFTLEVTLANAAPEVQSTIPNQVMTVGDVDINIDLDTVFVDPDGDVLSYSLATADDNVQLNGASIILAASQVGSESYTVTASDGEFQVSTTFSVTVEAPPQSFEFFTEAEAHTWGQGTVDSNHAGFTGSGFVNTDNYTGNWVEFSVDVPAAGTYTLTLRYANGSTARPFSVAVNGTTQINSLAINSTGAWATWAEQTTTLQLQAGVNTIRMVALNSGGAANIDWYRIEN